MYRSKRKSMMSFTALVLLYSVLFAPLGAVRGQDEETLNTETLKQSKERQIDEIALEARNANDNQQPCDKSQGHGEGLLRKCSAGSSSGVSKGDFNGDNYADIAIGVQNNVFRDGAGNFGAGAVNVIYGGPDGLDPTCCAGRPGGQIWTQDSENVPGLAEVDDNFGAALASGDFNGDGFSDLAIGVPFEDTDGGRGAGAVNVIYGSFAGLTTTAGTNIPMPQIWTQDSTGIPGVAEANDSFGRSLTWGDFNDDGKGDLVIAVPGDKVNNIPGAGSVNILYGTSAGLSAANSQIWSQDSLGVPDQAETYDHFASSLTAGDFNGDGSDDLGVGIPNENLVRSDGSILNTAGGVNIIYGLQNVGLTATSSTVPNSQFWTQDSSFVPDTADPSDKFGASLAAGDFDGNGSADLAIGVPNEDLGVQPVSNEGAVNIIYGRSVGLSAVSGIVVGGQQDVTAQLWSENSVGVPDDAEDNDFFGQVLAAGDFNGDGKKDLAIGVPQEEPDEVRTDAGAVFVIYGSSVRLSATILPAQMWTEDSPGISGTSERGDNFGASLSAWNFGFGNAIIADLVVGIPGQDVFAKTDAGAINAIYGSAGGLDSAGNRTFNQDSTGVPGVADEGDRFGGSLY